MAIFHTSEQEIGQIYIPFINWSLLIGVVRSSWVWGVQRPGRAYGVAVTAPWSSTRARFRRGVAAVARNRLLTLFGALVFLLWTWPSSPPPPRRSCTAAGSAAGGRGDLHAPRDVEARARPAARAPQDGSVDSSRSSPAGAHPPMRVPAPRCFSAPTATASRTPSCTTSRTTSAARARGVPDRQNGDVPYVGTPSASSRGARTASIASRALRLQGRPNVRQPGPVRVCAEPQSWKPPSSLAGRRSSRAACPAWRSGASTSSSG